MRRILLIFTILSSCATNWIWRIERADEIFTSSPFARSFALCWFTAELDLLEYPRWSTSTTHGDNTDIFNCYFPDLPLERRPDRATNPPIGHQILESELGRCIRWQICNTDCDMPLSGSAEQASYSILPKHKHVCEPKNAPDEDLRVHGPKFSCPEHEKAQLAIYCIE